MNNLRLWLIALFLISACTPDLSNPNRGDDDDTAADDDDTAADDDDTAADDDDTTEPTPDDDDDPLPPPIGDFQAGWYFGKCGGACVGTLYVENDYASYAISDWTGVVYWEMAAPFTVEGWEMWQNAQQRVSVNELEPIYGCPDCGDGGGRYLQWDLGPVLFRTDYEYGSPPEELVELDAAVSRVIWELQSCSFDEWLTAPFGCEPWEG